MSDVNISMGRREFISKFRETLPDNLRFLDDEAVFSLASRARPYITTAKFRPDAEEDPGFFGAIGKETQLTIKRYPEIGAALFGMIATKSEDPKSPAYERINKFSSDLYKAARASVEDSIANDEDLTKYLIWAGQNPFTWAKFLTDPSTLGRVTSQAILSMGQIMTAGIVGTALGGPIVGTLSAGSVAFALEGSEAYGEAYRRAEEKGIDEQGIANIARESGLSYGAISTVLETLVPLSIIRSMGFGKILLPKNFSRYSAKYLDNIVDGVKPKQAMFKAMKELSKENLSIMQRINTMGRYMGKNAIMESATEASQYLTEEAILDGKIDGRSVTLDWLQEKMQTSEFNESVAGGLVGGGIMSGPGGLSKYKGSVGKQAAGHAQKLQGKKKDEYIDYILNSNELSYNDKVEFSRGMVKLEGISESKDIEKQVVTPISKEPVVKEKVTKPKKEPVEPILEPSEPVIEPEFEPDLGPPGFEPTKISDKKIIGRSPSEKVFDFMLKAPEKVFEDFVAGKLTKTPKQFTETMALLRRAIEQNKDIKAKVESDKAVFEVMRSLRGRHQKLVIEKAIGDLEGTEEVAGLVSEPVTKPKVPKKVVKPLPWSEKIVEPTEPKKFKKKVKPVPSKEELTSGLINQNMTDEEVDSFLKPIFDFKPSLQRRISAKKLGWTGPEGSVKAILSNIQARGTRTQSLLAKYILKNVKEDLVARWGDKKIRTSVYQRRQKGKMGIPVHGVFMYPGLTVTNFTDTFLHETIHALTSQRLESPRGYVMTSNLNALRQNARLHMPVGKEEIGLYYGLSNVHEFVSEALSNKKFQEWLDTIPSTLGKREESIWQAIKRIIFKIFGIPTTKGSTLAEAMTQILNLVDVVPEEKFGDIELYHYKTNDIHAFDEFMHPEQVEDEGGPDRYHESFGKEVDPAEFVNRFLSNVYGIYIDKIKTYPKMVQIAQKYRNRSLADKPTFYKFEGEITKLLKKETLIPFKVDPTGPKFQDGLKEWYQRVNSRVNIALAHKIPKGYIQHDSSPKKRWRKAITVLNPRFDGTFDAFSVDDLLDISPVDASKQANTEIQNFVEEDFNNGLPIKLVYISAKSHIFTHVRKIRSDGSPIDRWFKAKPGDFTINGKSINDMNNRFAIDYQKALNEGRSMPLYFFLADTSGDNAQIVLSAISPNSLLAKTIIDKESFIEYLKQEAIDGNIKKEHLTMMLESTKKKVKENKYIYLQMVAFHHRMKQIKGRRYLLREKNIADSWKRLKLDLTKGWVPRGMGNSKIMYVNTEKQDIVFEIPDETGTLIDVSAMHGNRYRNDGWLMTSQDYFNRLYNVSGVKTKVMKSVIRHLNTDTLEDYIAVKMSEMTPFEGMKVYEKKDDKRILLATYENSKWKDAKGEIFDRFGTMDEVKDVDGRFKEMGIIHTLPEDATRIMYTTDTSASDAAHPILGHELGLTTQFMTDNPLASEYLKLVKEHYNDTANEYLDRLYSFRDNPKELRDFVHRDLQKGELPTELQQIIELFPNGEGLMIQNIIRQIIPMLNHRFLNNGLYKMRQLKKGKATHVSIKPRGSLNISQGSIMVSADNKVIRSLLSKDSGFETVDGINAWLEVNDYWVLVHRQPIQGFTKVQPRKIQKLVDGHGETAFLTEDDVFRLHEADFDGDTIFIEKLPNDNLINVLNKLIESETYKKRNRTIYLEMFGKGDLGGSLANYSERLKLLEKNSRLISSQGNIVNAKTMLHTLSYKGVSFNLGPVTISIYNPEDKVTLRYWPLDSKALNSTVDSPFGSMTMKELILKEGDEIIDENGILYLRTTKENEFSLLLQAAVDNEKFGLLNKIDFIDAGNQDIGLNGWLLTRIFKRSKDVWTRKQISMLRAIYKHFNYSQDRQGVDENRNTRGINRNIERSKSVAAQYYNSATGEKRSAEQVNKTIFNNIKVDITSKRMDVSLFKNFTTSATNEDLRMTPSELIVSAIGAKDLVDETIMAKKGIELRNPFLMHSDNYINIHVNAMEDITDFFSELDEAVNNPGIRSEIFKGMDLGQRIGEAYYKVFEDAKAERRKQGFTEEALEMQIVKPEYNDGMQELIASFIQEWHDASDITKKYSTAWFLKGIRVVDAKGKHEKIDKVLSLPPIYLLHLPTLYEYGKAHVKYVYKPLAIKARGTKLRFPKLTKKFAIIEELEGVRCG